MKTHFTCWIFEGANGVHSFRHITQQQNDSRDSGWCFISHFACNQFECGENMEMIYRLQFIAEKC